MATNYGEILDTSVNIISPPVKDSSGPNAAAIAIRGIADAISIFDDDRKARAASKRQAATDARLAAKDLLDKRGRDASGDALLQAIQVNKGTHALMQPRTVEVPGGGGDVAYNDIFGSQDAVLTEDAKAAQADAIKGAMRIKSYETAMEQGTVPGLGRDAVMDEVFQSLGNKHGTDMLPVIYKTLKEAGLQGSLLNELTRETDVRKTMETAEDKEVADAFEVGSSFLTEEEKGLLGNDAIVATGRDIRAANSKLEQTLQALQIQKTEGEIGRSSYEFEKGIQAEDLQITANQTAIANLAPLLNAHAKLAELAGRPGADVGLTEKLADSTVRLQQASATIINNVVAGMNIQNPEAATKVRTSLQAYVDSQVAPLLERNEQYTAAIKSIDNRLGLSVAAAAPLIGSMKAAGMDVNLIPALMEAISEDDVLTGRLKAEIKGLKTIGDADGFNSNTAKIQLTEIMSLMNGNATLDNYTDAKSKDYLSKIRKAVADSLAPPVAKGDFTNADGFMNSMAVIVTATNTINQNSGEGAVNNSAYALTQGKSKTAIERLMQNPETADEAKVIGIGMRAASAKNATIYRKMAATKKDGYWGVAFVDGRYKPVFDEKAWQAERTRARSGGTGLVPGGTTQGIMPAVKPTEPPSKLQGFVNLANSTVSFLADTNSWEKDSPKGTNKELRELYGQGKMTSAMKAEAAKAVKERKNSKADKLRAFDEFDRAVEQSNTLIAPTIDNSTPYDVVLGNGKYGKPPKPITQMTFGEVHQFGSEVLIPNTIKAGVGVENGEAIGSSAQGAYQITNRTMRKFAPKVLGANWRDEPYSPENQEKVAKAIFEEAKRTRGERMDLEWEGLTRAEAKAVSKMSWEEARYIIAGKESSATQGSLI